MKLRSLLIPGKSTAISLSIGMLIEAGGDRFVLTHLIESNAVVQNLATQEYRVTSQKKIIEDLQKEEIATPELDDARKRLTTLLGPRAPALLERQAISEAALTRATSLLLWIYTLEERGFKVGNNPRTRTEINRLSKNELAQAEKFSPNTLYKAWLKIKKFGGDPLSLVPDFNGRGGPGVSRLNPKVEKIIEEKIEQGGIATRSFELVEAVRDAIDIENATTGESLAYPSPSSMSRRLKEVKNEYAVLQAIDGRKKAEKIFRSNSSPRPVAIRPNDTLEGDDVDMGVYLIDERVGLPWGHSYCTNMLDQLTSVPTGYEMSPTFRAFESAIEAIGSALLPKDPTHPDFEFAKGSWIGYGTPAKILLDNARYNKSRQINQQTDHYALFLSRTAPYKPTGKSAIEHYNYAVKSLFCPTIQGWRGEKRDADAVKHGIASANQTIESLRKLYVQWVVDIYLNLKGDDGYTAKERWQRYYAKHTPAVRWTQDDINFMQMRPKTLKFRDSGGLLRNRVSYDNLELQEIRKKYGKNAEVQTYYSTRDLTKILVLNPMTDRRIWVPNTDTSGFYDHLTEKQLKLIRAVCVEMGLKHPGRHDLVVGRERLRQITAELALSPKMMSRKKAKFTEDVAKSKGTEPVSPPKPPQKMTELEYEMSLLDDLEAEEEIEEAA